MQGRAITNDYVYVANRHSYFKAKYITIDSITYGYTIYDITYA